MSRPMLSKKKTTKIDVDCVCEREVAITSRRELAAIALRAQPRKLRLAPRPADDQRFARVVAGTARTLMFLASTVTRLRSRDPPARLRLRAASIRRHSCF
jgi:hypothetical protein